MTPEAALRARLVCPLTRTPLRFDVQAQELVSEAAGLAYPIRRGMPVMLVEEARPTDAEQKVIDIRVCSSNVP